MQPGDNLAVHFTEGLSMEMDCTRFIEEDPSMKHQRSREPLSIFDCFDAFTQRQVCVRLMLCMGIFVFACLCVCLCACTCKCMHVCLQSHLRVFLTSGNIDSYMRAFMWNNCSPCWLFVDFQITGL